MANGLTRHTLFFSDTRLELECDCEALNDAIEKDWAAARQPMLRTTKTHRLEVHATDRLILTFDDECVWREPLDETPADAFEWVLYRRMFAEHHPRFGVFHGAAVVSNEVAWFFCGPSGAGKSSLSVAASRRGYDYYTDEFVVTDGSAIWGWPRTPHFDALPSSSEALPPWFAGLGAPDEHGTFRQRVRHEHVARAPTPAGRVHVVLVERGPMTELAPVASSTALHALSEAAFFESPIPLGGLVAPTQTWRGVWRHPEELLDALERVASAPVHARALGR